MKVATLWRASIALLVLLGLILGSESLFEDQVGKDDWYDSFALVSAFIIQFTTYSSNIHLGKALVGPKTDHFRSLESKGLYTTSAKSSSLISMEDLEETRSTSLRRKEQSHQCLQAP